MIEAEGEVEIPQNRSQYLNSGRSKAVLLLWFLTVTCSCCPYLYFGSPIILVDILVNFRQLNDHLSGKELFIRFTARAFHKLLSIYVFSYFPFGFEGRMWDLIVSVPDHCLSFYFVCLSPQPGHIYLRDCCQFPEKNVRSYWQSNLSLPVNTFSRLNERVRHDFNSANWV